MTKRALVIGAQTAGLTGAEGDARRVAEMLDGFGFVADLRLAGDATREGILAGYERLSLDTRPNDAAVVYYSGHGNYAVNLDATASQRTFQDIVPTDYDQSVDADYRGITAWELSIQLRRLTARSKNVTVILDCCHAALMSRDGAVQDAIPRALPNPLHLSFGPHLAALEARYPGELAALDVHGNPDAVRMVACAQSESAYEYTNDKAVRTGAFTEALLELLVETRDVPISWAQLGQALRWRVLRRFPSQRPGVEGPAHRQLFSLIDQASSEIVPIVPRRGGSYEIAAGDIHGVTVGDTYDIASFAATTRVAARGAVTRTRPTTAEVVITSWVSGATAIPADSVAVPVTRAAVQRAVVVAAPATERTAVAAAFASARTLRIAAPDEVNRGIATLRIADDRMTIEDTRGLLFPPAVYPASLAAVVHKLANLGVAQALRELEGEAGVLARELAIDWGVIDDGAMRSLPDHGVALGLKDRIYCRVKNTAKRDLHVHIFNLGLSGEITLLTRYAPAGIHLGHGAEVNLGEGHDGTLVGLGLSWPDGLPKETFPRIDTILVIATTAPANLTSLETQAGVTRRARSMGMSGLQQLVAQLQDGGTRGARVQPQLDGYFAKQLTYFLHPRAGRMASPEFLIDNNPRGQAAGRSARAWLAPTAGTDAPPRAIAVRLAELVIEDNHALFSADIRIDALICTRAGAGAPGYRVETIPFKRVQDGQRLPLENALLYLGPVRDFVDISLWVSRDTSGGQSLGDLLASRASSPEVKDATTALLTTAGITAPWIAAVGASAVLARVAYDVILRASNTTIGLYRTSFLASEAFGVGRYPPQGRYRAQDLSFALLIDAVPEPTA
jgi:caspase domain-containing protein